jgi:hypothetical protein
MLGTKKKERENVYLATNIEAPRLSRFRILEHKKFDQDCLAKLGMVVCTSMGGCDRRMS